MHSKRCTLTSVPFFQTNVASLMHAIESSFFPLRALVARVLKVPGKADRVTTGSEPQFLRLLSVREPAGGRVRYRDPRQPKPR